MTGARRLSEAKCGMVSFETKVLRVLKVLKVLRVLRFLECADGRWCYYLIFGALRTLRTFFTKGIIA